MTIKYQSHTHIVCEKPLDQLVMQFIFNFLSIDMSVLNLILVLVEKIFPWIDSYITLRANNLARVTSAIYGLEAVWCCGPNSFLQNFNFFFVLLKLSAVCTFWIVLMCWYQKWFLKNKKTLLACFSARKAIWKATITTLPNTLLIMLQKCFITLFPWTVSIFKK